jgi:hypothetical protein
MKITFLSDGRLMIDGAKITWRNFAGKGSDFNREGDRNFAVIIDNQDDADRLAAAGWKIKVKPPREDGDDPFIVMPVKVKFNDRGPNAYLVCGTNKIPLNEDTIHRLDRVDILSVDMDIRPYDWEHPRFGTGRTAYLDAIQVFQKVDRFASDYSEY